MEEVGFEVLVDLEGRGGEGIDNFGVPLLYVTAAGPVPWERTRGGTRLNWSGMGVAVDLAEGKPFLMGEGGRGGGPAGEPFNEFSR